VTTIGKYRQACAKHGVSPDFENYRSGHAHGVQNFCQPVQGFNYGRGGGTYQGVCPVDLAAGFVAAYNDGRHFYDLESAVRSTDAQIAQRKRSLANINDALTQSEAALIREGSSAEERLTLLAETKELARQHGVIEAEIVELERGRVLHAQALAEYRSALAYVF